MKTERLFLSARLRGAAWKAVCWAFSRRQKELATVISSGANSNKNTGLRYVKSYNVIKFKVTNLSHTQAYWLGLLAIVTNSR